MTCFSNRGKMSSRSGPSYSCLGPCPSTTVQPDSSPSSEVSHHGGRAWPTAHPEKVPLSGFCLRKPHNASSPRSIARKCILSTI